MDKVTADRITQIAPLLERFLTLHPDEQQWLLPLLGRAERRAIAILEEIDGHALSYNEIAKLTDTHPTTVKHILYALGSGGVAFKSGTSGKWVSPKGGRKRKLLRIE